MIGDFVVGARGARRRERDHRLLIDDLERTHAADEPARKSTCSHDPSFSLDGDSLLR